MEIITQLFSDNFIEALGWTVLHSLWQATLIVIMVGFLLLSIPKKSAKLRYGIASLGMFGILVAAIITFGYLYESASAVPFPNGLDVFLTEQLYLIQEGTTIDSFFQSCQNYFNNHLPIIVGLWLLGFTFFLFRLLGGLLYVQYLRRRSVLLQDIKWLKMLQQLKIRLSTEKQVGLAESAMIKVPMVIGHLKPIILFPIGMINHLSIEEVEAILAHELAHIYRNDYLINIIQSVIETLFYYHPAVWWLSWIIQTEREHCCDDIAVQVSGSSLNYAKALVRLQELAHIPSPTFAMSFAGRKNQLLTRIQRLLNHPQKNSNFMEKLIATGLLTLAVFLFSLNADTKAEATIIDLPITHENTELPRIKSPDITKTTPAKVIPLTRLTPFLPTISRDTVPSTTKKGSHYSYYFNDGETFEVKSKDGKITSMTINGKDIPEEEYDKYKNELRSKKRPRTPVPPAPPAAPRYAPFALLTPPALPTPPTPPNFLWRDKNNGIVKWKKDKDGHSFLSITKEDQSDPITIHFDNDDDQIIVDGQVLTGEQKALFEDELEEYLENSISEWVEDNSDLFEENIEEWAEDFGEKMGAWGEEFGESVADWFDGVDEEETASYQEEWADYQDEMESFREEANDRLEEARINRLEISEAQKEEIRQLREEAHDKMEEYKERMKELRQLEKERLQEMKEEDNSFGSHLKESLEEGLKHLMFEAPSFKANHMIYEQLVDDGLAKDGKKFSYKLNKDKLTINGKRQSKSMHQKYLKIYEKALGRPMKDSDSTSVKGKMNRDDNSFKGSMNISDEKETHRL